MVRESSALEVSLPHAVRPRREEFPPRSHKNEIALWEPLDDDTLEKTSTQSFLCRLESREVPGRCDETGDELSFLPTFAAEHAAAHWYHELEVSVVCQKGRPTEGSADFGQWTLQTAKNIPCGMHV